MNKSDPDNRDHVNIASYLKQAAALRRMEGEEEIDVEAAGEGAVLVLSEDRFADATEPFTAELEAEAERQL